MGRSRVSILIGMYAMVQIRQLTDVSSCNLQHHWAELAVATVRKIETGAVIEPGYFTILALQQALGARYEDTTALPLASRCHPWSSHLLVVR